MHPFRTAVEAWNHEAMVATLAEDVVFHSPAVYKAYQGKQTVATLLAAVMSLAEDFVYIDEITDGNTTVLVFKARVGDREIEGIDMLKLDAQGLIADFTVMIRPLSGLQAIAAAMQARLAAPPTSG